MTAPIAALADALNGDRAIVARACDALDRASEAQLADCDSRHRLYAQHVALSLDELKRLRKVPALDAAARDRQHARRREKHARELAQLRRRLDARVRDVSQAPGARPGDRVFSTLGSLIAVAAFGLVAMAACAALIWVSRAVL